MILPFNNQDAVYIGQTEVIKAYDGSTLVWQKPIEYFKITNLQNGTNTIQFGRSADPGTSTTQGAVTIEYSTNDGSSWTSYTIAKRQVTHLSISLAKGKSVLFRGNNSSFTLSDFTSALNFNGSGSFSVSGDIMTLLDKTGQLRTITIGTFVGLFMGSKVTDASNLKLTATSAPSYVYASMFQNCTSLINPPTTISLTTLPENCFQAMYSGCTSLTTMPTLPWTELSSGCYCYMFQKCTSLENAIELPATTLASFCYSQMFSGCTSLGNAPEIELPATRLASFCYSQMFSGCTSLVNAPEIRSTNIGYNSAVSSMFYNCSSLKKVILHVTTWAYGCASDWLSGVSSTGDLYNLGGATNIPTGTNGKPSGWTMHTSL